MADAHWVIFSGIKTCALTNNWTNDTGKDFTSIPPFFHYFDEVFESCKLGLCKPDPDVYTYVCSKMGVKPSEVCSKQPTLARSISMIMK